MYHKTKLRMHEASFRFVAKRLLFENFDSPRNKTQRKAKFKKRIHSLNKTWSKTFIKRENKTF